MSRRRNRNRRLVTKNEETNKEGFNTMEKTNNSEESNTNNNNTDCERAIITGDGTASHEKKNGHKIGSFMREAAVAIVATIAATAIINAYGVFSDLKTIPDDVKELNQRVTSLSTNIESYKAQFQSQLSELLILKGQFQEFEKNQIFFAPTVYPTDNMVYAIQLASVSNQNENGETMMVISSDDIVAESGDGSKKISASEIINQKVLMPYESDGVQVYFVGQLNENMHWNGDCLLNKYNKENELIFLSEAMYSDGNLLSYKQAFLESDGETWCISERTLDGEYYDGISVDYANITTHKKTFDMSNVIGSDMITLADFDGQYVLTSKMVKFYYGKTKDGVYNDNSGKAYYISFDNDGYVQTLYVGRFVNGKFNETEHDSWEITRKTADGDLNKKYEYFKGNFKDNNKLIDEFMIFKPTLEINDIKELIEGVYFQPRLIWYGEGI